MANSVHVDGIFTIEELKTMVREGSLQFPTPGMDFVFELDNNSSVTFSFAQMEVISLTIKDEDVERVLTTLSIAEREEKG